MKKTQFKPYCLYCYAPLELKQFLCSRCNASSPVSLRQKYWTRESRILEIEKALKVLILTLTVITTVIIAIATDKVGVNFMFGWFLTVPSLFAIPLWVTVSRLTARGGPTTCGEA